MTDINYKLNYILGLLGWYMVKSGLDPKNFEGPNDVPRVSQYRLAAHLSSAMILYSFLLWNSCSILLPPAQNAKTVAAKALPLLANFRKLAMTAKGLVFITAGKSYGTQEQGYRFIGR